MTKPAKYVISLFQLALLLFVTTGSANACWCTEPRSLPCEAYWDASAVFIGMVRDISFTTVGEGDRRYRQALVRFSVKESFSGIEGPEAEVVNSFGTCGFPFVIAEYYIVYAYRVPQDKRLQTSICTRTREYAEAIEDLQYIRGLSKAASGSRIYGEVRASRHYARPDQAPSPMQGIRVSMTGVDKRTETITDSNGEFSVSGLPSGTYKVSISLSPGPWAYEVDKEIKVADRGCATAYFRVESSGRLGGRAIDATGQPMPKAEIVLVKAEDFKTWEHIYPDKDGLYQFSRAPSGRYFLVVRSDGVTFPQIYYPGVAKRELATIVSVGDGERIENLDVRVPSSLRERTISGIVERSDGTPIPEASITYAVRDERLSYAVKPDKQGRFSINVYDGLNIMMRASAEREKGVRFYSEWVHVSAASDEKSVRLVVPIDK